MKKLWTVCILLAFAALAFAGTDKVDQKAEEGMTIEKAIAYFNEGLPISPEMKEAIMPYLQEEAGVENGRLDDTGGPDAFGYTFEDNINGGTVPFSWIELCGDPSAIEVPTGDDSGHNIAISFAFPCYGASYTTVRISSNGQVRFDASNGGSNAAMSSSNTLPAISPFWDDLDPDGAGPVGTGCNTAVGDQEVYYRDFGTYFVVSWTNVNHYSESTDRYNFQAILYNNGRIKFQYNTNWFNGTIGSTSATIGIDGPATAGIDYLYNGVPATRLTPALGGRAIEFRPPAAPPSGRCCYAAGCAVNTQAQCTTLGGTWTVGLNCNDNPCPINLQGGETCAQAPAVAVGGTYLGTTVGALDDDPNLWCGTGSSNTAGDVWYTLVGNGNSITVETCVASGGYDMELGVYCGSCGAFNCVGTSDDACGTQSRVTFCSAAGTTYYILVDGYSTATGAYQLAVINGASCSTAINCRPQGRCCYVDNTGAPACADVYAEDCVTLGGEFNATLTCATPCPTGSCCYTVPGSTLCDPKACVDGVLASQCAVLGGAWTLNGVCETTCPVSIPCVCECSTLPNSHSVVAASPADYVILDNATVCLTINVPFQYHITDLNVSLDLVHTFDGDLDITLTSPMGTVIDLCSDNGVGGDNMTCTVLDDEATTLVTAGTAPFTGSFIPEVALSSVDGENAVGNWLLCIADDANGDVGYVIGACLTFEYDIILPAEFGGFSAVSRDGEVALNWNTLSERELVNYEVSRDGSVIAVVDAQNSATGAEYSFVDANVTNGTTYHYSLTVTDVIGGRQELATVEATPGSSSVVSEYALHQNYPNPFNPTTNIAFDMVEAGHVSISVYNVMGQKVAELVNGNVEAGRHTVSFDAASLSSGLYLYKMEANGFTAQSKMVLMK